MRELAFGAGRIVVANRMATLPALPPKRPERLADGRLLGLLRPLLAWRLGPLLHRTGKAEFLADDLKRGPYTYLVLALDGLPAAGVLRNALDAAWASPHTTSRAKALVFAVVARGLGCRHAEREAFRILAEEGLGEAQTERILADLAGPELDPVEAAFVPYARETLWYKPAPIQRRGRELLQQLTCEQFVELMGVASLANMVCRLDVILDDP
jgi:alkylhydroperoxidase family enzyme